VKKAVLLVLILAIILRGNASAQAGNLDSTFGINGKVTTSLASGNEGNIIYDMEVQSDGKIIAVGKADIPGPPDCAYGLARYQTNGKLDSTFAGYGAIMGGFGNYTYSSARLIVLQADGKILIGGDAFYSAMARYNSNGTIDYDFGNNGEVEFAELGFGLGSMGLQSDEKIIVGGGEIPESGFH